MFVAVWEVSDIQEAAKPLLLFLSALYQLIGKMEGGAQQQSYMLLSANRLRRFHELDEPNFDRSNLRKSDEGMISVLPSLNLITKRTSTVVLSMTPIFPAPKQSEPVAFPPLATSTSQLFWSSPPLSSHSIAPDSTTSAGADTPSTTLRDESAKLNEELSQIRVRFKQALEQVEFERGAKRALEDAMRIGELAHRSLEDTVTVKQDRMVELEHELCILRTAGDGSNMV